MKMIALQSGKTQKRRKWKTSCVQDIDSSQVRGSTLDFAAITKQVFDCASKY
jgi:hypothetical protein